MRYGFQKNMGDICINVRIQCTFADTSVCFCYACHLPSHHVEEVAFGRSPLWIPLYGGWGNYIVAGEVVNIAKTYTHNKNTNEVVDVILHLNHINKMTESSRTAQQEQDMERGAN